MVTIIKSNIIDEIYSKIDVEHNEVKKIVDSIFDEIRDTLESGENVRISGFGNFILRDKVSRPGRNPKTGKDVEISARRVVTFKAGQKFRKKVEDTK